MNNKKALEKIKYKFITLYTNVTTNIGGTEA
jgi:hypothetical protein